MINITTTGTDPDAWKGNREPIFTIDGQEYTIPVEIPARISLMATRRLAELGEVAGGVWLMTFLLGQDGWDALEKCPDVTPADLKAIQAVIRQKTFGAMEEEGKD